MVVSMKTSAVGNVLDNLDAQMSNQLPNTGRCDQSALFCGFRVSSDGPVIVWSLCIETMLKRKSTLCLSGFGELVFTAG